MGKILINMRILQDSFHVRILSTRVNRGAQDISMWGLAKSCECHMALVSVSLGPKNLESIHIKGLSIYYNRVISIKALGRQ